MAIQYGIKLVFGVPEQIKPIKGIPPGKVLLKLRCDKFASLFVRTDEGIKKFFIKDSNGEWSTIPQARNVRWTETKPQNVIACMSDDDAKRLSGRLFTRQPD